MLLSMSVAAVNLPACELRNNEHLMCCLLLYAVRSLVKNADYCFMAASSRSTLMGRNCNEQLAANRRFLSLWMQQQQQQFGGTVAEVKGFERRKVIRKNEVFHFYYTFASPCNNELLCLRLRIVLSDALFTLQHRLSRFHFISSPFFSLGFWTLAQVKQSSRHNKKRIFSFSFRNSPLMIKHQGKHRRRC